MTAGELLRFPEGFVWGTATSAYQIEGAAAADGKGASIWDTFSHLPGKTRDGATGDVAVDHYHRWPEDVGLMADLGIRAYRFSTSWSRILPEGRGRVNAAGLDFYDRLVDELLAHGIEPYIALFHYDLPQALQDLGGWPSREVVDYFGDYAGVVAARLGDRVTRWITHNEPLVTAMLGYFTGEHAPGIQDPVATMRAGHHLLLSHSCAAEALRAAASRPIKVGITLNLSPVYPASDSDEDRQAAERADELMNRIALDWLLVGHYPPGVVALYEMVLADSLRPGDLTGVPDLDFLGVNYYSRTVIRHDPTVPIMSAGSVLPEGNDYSQMWEIYPPGMYALLRRIWDDYHPAAEIQVAENGVPVPDGLDFDGRVRDVRRIGYLRDHLAQVHRAIADGIPVSGYFVWSLLDNFEWAHGYAMRFGLVYVDYPSLRRTVKDSGRWFAQVIRDNGVRAD